MNRRTPHTKKPGADPFSPRVIDGHKNTNRNDAAQGKNETARYPGAAQANEPATPWFRLCENPESITPTNLKIPLETFPSIIKSLIISIDPKSPLAIECKGGAVEIKPSTVRRFREKFPATRLIVASMNDERKRIASGVEIFPWHEVLEIYTAL